MAEPSGPYGLRDFCLDNNLGSPGIWAAGLKSSKGGRLKAQRWVRFYSVSDKDHDFISLEAVDELIMKEEGAEINATDHISVKAEERIR